MKTVAMLAVALTVLAWAAPAAQADSEKWPSVRVLDCGTAGTITAVLNPAGFGTPFHDQNSGSVLVPRRVITNGITVMDKPGIDENALSEITCSYVDPLGRNVVVTGILTPASP